MMRRRGIKIVCYLDDLIINSDFFENGAREWSLLLISLGFSVDWGKLVAPTTKVQFLGLIIDSALRRIELPQGKFMKLEELARTFLARSKVTEKEL